MANVLTEVGEEWVVDRLAQSDGGAYSSNKGNWVGWGTGAGTSNKTNTTLFTQSNDPVSTNMGTGVVSKTGTTSAAKWHCVATLSSTSSQTITNAGTFSSSNASTAALFVNGDFTGIPLVNGHSIQFTFTLDPA